MNHLGTKKNKTNKTNKTKGNNNRDVLRKVKMATLRNYQTLCCLGSNKSHREGWYKVDNIRSKLSDIVDIETNGLPERKVIRKVARAMNITGRDLMVVVDNICQKAINPEISTPIIRSLIRNLSLDIKNNSNDKYRLVQLLYQILHPKGFPDRVVEDEQEYKRLIAKQKSERDGPSSMTADDIKRLEAMMSAKVCKCVKEQYLLHRFRYLVLGLSPEGIPPEAICQWSIFNQRGFKGFDLQSCDKRFRWYRDLHKVSRASFPDFPPQDLISGKAIKAAEEDHTKK